MAKKKKKKNKKSDYKIVAYLVIADKILDLIERILNIVDKF